MSYTNEWFTDREQADVFVVVPLEAAQIKKRKSVPLGPLRNEGIGQLLENFEVARFNLEIHHQLVNILQTDVLRRARNTCPDTLSVIDHESSSQIGEKPTKSRIDGASSPLNDDGTVTKRD